MTQDLTFALLFNYPNGPLAALEAVKALLPGAEQVRGNLVYMSNVLKFERNPLQGEDKELELQISAFPLSELDAIHQRIVIQRVREALSIVAGDVEVLAEDELL